MLGLWHFQNGVTHGVQGYFLVICDICNMWCVMCDVLCNMKCALSHLSQSHGDGGVVTYPKWCHTGGPGLYSGDLWHLWHVMCDVTCDVPCHVYYSPMVMLGLWHFQNGVTHGVWGCFLVICDICDMWCVMCDVWHKMGPPTCHTYHTWHTVKISAKSVRNWLSNCYFCLCCIFFETPFTIL